MDLQVVKEIIADVLQVSEDKITPDKDFEKDLNADSLDRVEIIMNIEDRLNIEIPDDSLENIKTVQDAFDAVAKLA